MKLMYIAAPFSGESPEDVALNIEAARQYGKLIARKGWMPVIPHANTAGFDLTNPSIGYEFWIEGTKELLRRCDAAFFGPGWENSKGSKGELDEALLRRMPCFFETKEVPDLTPREVR